MTQLDHVISIVATHVITQRKRRRDMTLSLFVDRPQELCGFIIFLFGSALALRELFNLLLLGLHMSLFGAASFLARIELLER